MSSEPVAVAVEPTNLSDSSQACSATCSPLDLGVLLKSNTLNSLDKAEKLKLIQQVPDPRLNYPVKQMYGRNRRFKPEWAQKHPWLHYSSSEDSVYCKACVLFAPTDIHGQKLGMLVNKPFSNWTKQSSYFSEHEKLDYHKTCMARLLAFKESCLNPLQNVSTMLSESHDKKVAKNAQIVKSLLKCVCFCGRQGIALRGHREDSTAPEDSNMGNFIELVKFRAENDEVLNTYLKTAPKNALYTSKTIQNEMIEVIGTAIENQIIQEIKAAKFFTILADEVTDCSNLEQVSLVIRFVDAEKNIREEFLGFITVERITGEYLATALLSWLKYHNLDVAFCRGQGYDGASSMSSSKTGVQGRIRSISPTALYTHCHSHQLNLCIVKACSIPQIRNASSVISEVSKFFNYSPKRQHFFENVLDEVSPNEQKKKLKDVCRTRWVQRIDSYTVFFDLYSPMMKTMEAISTGCTEFGEWSWDSETLTKARGFLHQMVSFEFLVTSNITMRVLSSLRSLTVKLQKKSNDILAAYEYVSEVLEEFQEVKSNCETEFHSWYLEIESMADELNIVVATPRINARQSHRSNIPAECPEDFYRRNIVIPFLDHITTELTERFGSQIQQTKVKLLGLVPSIVASNSLQVLSIKEVGELYKSDIPFPRLLETEFQRWRTKHLRSPPQERAETLNQALRSCDEHDFPNIFTLLQIACTLPVTTCETERSNSQLKLLKTYLRSTMTEKRLTSLALMKIHRSLTASLNLDQLVVDFANKHPRRMALPCILGD